MDARHNCVVYGYVRMNYKEDNMVDDIIGIIYEYYLLKIVSKLLTSNEEIALRDLIFTALKKQKDNKNMTEFDAKILYRASDNDYSSSKWSELCYDKGSTLTIIHNGNNYIFGGYASKSFSDDAEDDPNAFLFRIRPTLKLYPLSKSYKEGAGVVWSIDGYGPIFGATAELYIADACNKSAHNECYDGTDTAECAFDFNAEELTGANRNEHDVCAFKVLEYETFDMTLQK